MMDNTGHKPKIWKTRSESQSAKWANLYKPGSVCPDCGFAQLAKLEGLGKCTYCPECGSTAEDKYPSQSQSQSHSVSVYHSPSPSCAEGHYQDATLDIAHYAAHLGWMESDIQKAMEVVAGEAWDEPVFLGHPDSGGLVTKAHNEVEDLGWRRLDIILAFGLVAAHKAGLLAWRE